MKHLLLSAAIASIFGLTACSGDSHQDIINDTGTPTPLSRIAFDPGAGVLPLPNDLLFSGTLDGTLEIPGEAESMDYTDPQIALGALDGWSTIMPMSIDVVPGSDGVMVDPASASAAGSVRMFEVVLGGPLSPDPECMDSESLSICKVGEELMWGEDFITQASGNSINLVPLKPLPPVTSYAVITTSQLMDSNGDAIAASTTYELLKLDINTDPLVTPSQLLLQRLTNNYENQLASAHSVDKAGITYSGVFTTQSVPDVVTTVAQLMADGFNPAGPTVPVSPFFTPDWLMPPTPINQTAAQLLGLTPEDGLAYVFADMADVYVGQLALPYYQMLPTVGEAGVDINGRFGALGDSPVAVLQLLEAGVLSQEEYATQAAAQGIDPGAALMDPSLLVGAQFFLADGSPVDPQKHLTRFNPLPNPFQNLAEGEMPGAVPHKLTVPVQVTVPNAEKLIAFYASQGAPYTPPAAGWPISVTMHGLGGVKELNLAYAGVYAVKGIATISIDMPLHGERSVDLNGDMIFDVSATDPSVGELLGDPRYVNGNPLAFVNIASSLTVRDNFRQAIADNLALRLSVGTWAAFEASMGMMPTVDATRVSMQGLSLGGIVGTSAAAYAGLLDGLLGEANPYRLTAASLVAPAGGLAGSFAGSATFGPILITTLVGELAPDCIDPMTGGIVESPECEAVVAQVQTEVLPPFAFAVQTAVDSMDPINHAAILAGSNVPVHLIEVVGNLEEGGDNPPDLVLPNTVPGFPLSGTEPLISALGLQAVTETVSDSAGTVSGAVRFRLGAHSSLISPDIATEEMQVQAADFALTDGRKISIGNGCLIQGGACEQ
ncbi:VolA/Pla-1 family phospholipase [Ferrimonas marina]|uniref:Extracellular lipase, Pla-1/cef family n=1 Tax=Ferrimonas marina TaxID=299255 RepID=A0A1M5SDR3_9GAMM|nr:VolA/Pla-1 family phospholipase [Ferrimonas marina]SHH36570.1 extracellular lipase, Pla-1/cef family [Ferrimonas marina]